MYLYIILLKKKELFSIFREYIGLTIIILVIEF